MSRYGQYSIANVNNGTLYSSNLSAPTSLLTRFQSSNDSARIVLDGLSGGSIIYRADGVSKWGVACISNNLQFLLNDNVSTVPVIFTSTGNVGIGTVSPAFPLSVKGAQSIYGTNGQTSIATASGNLLFYTSGDSYAHPTMNLFQYNHDNCALTFDMYLGNAGWLNATTGTGFMIYKVSNSLRIYYQTGTPGNTGTNTLSMMINSSGQVGIGTDSPNALLHIHGGQLPTTPLIITNTSNVNQQLMCGTYWGGAYSSSYSSVQSIVQGTAYNALSLNPLGGNVGIGITNPSQKLDVNGTVKATGFTLSGYNLLVPKMIYVGSQVLTGAFSGTTTASGVASYPVFIGAYNDSIIAGVFPSGSNPDTSQYFKAYYVTCQITTAGPCAVGAAFNNVMLTSGTTYSGTAFLTSLQSGFFLNWTQFPTQSAYSYQGYGLNLQVYQANTWAGTYSVNYITVHGVYLHTSYTNYPTVAGLTYNSSYQQFS